MCRRAKCDDEGPNEEEARAQGSSRRCEVRGWTYTRKRLETQEHRQPLEDDKGEETESRFRATRRNPFCQHLDVSPERQILDS